MLHGGVDDNLYANSAPGGNLVKNKLKIVLYFFSSTVIFWRNRQNVLHFL